MWRQLGLGDSVELQLNSIGSSEARAAYRTALVDYLESHRQALDEDSQRRLDSNPLRILDSKNADTQALLDSAPSLADYLDQESREDFEQLCALLTAAGVSFVINPRLVRGLDYYNKTVFEWVTSRLGAQGTICAGGRYDGLVEQLGGKATPGVGFAMGMERLVLLLIELGQQVPAATADVYVVAVGDGAVATALASAEALRDAMPGIRLVQNVGGGSFKSQMKKADKSGASVALIWGEDEVAAGRVTMKTLRGQSEQHSLPVDELTGALQVALVDNR